jgi:hypothetical protein
MAMNIQDRARIRALVSGRRRAILAAWPAMPRPEADRRARLGAVLRATAADLGGTTRRAREYIAENIGCAPDTLKMVLQGNRRIAIHKAVALVSMFPELLCLSDVLTVEDIPDVIHLHRQDLPAWDDKRKRAA